MCFTMSRRFFHHAIFFMKITKPCVLHTVRDFFFLKIVEVTKPCVFTMFERLKSTQKYRVHLFCRCLCFLFLLKSVKACVLRYFRHPTKKVPCKTRRSRSAAKKSRVFYGTPGVPGRASRVFYGAVGPSWRESRVF